MPTYTWEGANALRRGDGDDVEPGENFEADEDGPVVRAFGDLIDEVEVAAAAGDEQAEVQDAGETDAEPGAGTDAAEESGDDIDDLLDGTVDDVEAELETGDYDDRLDEVESRADRAGVEDAVEDRQG